MSRQKLLIIRCVREAGDCLEVDSEETIIKEPPFLRTPVPHQYYFLICKPSLNASPTLSATL